MDLIANGLQTIFTLVKGLKTSLAEFEDVSFMVMQFKWSINKI